MAWTEQAWRHSLVGITDPSQADTEEQWRLALAGVPNASDIYYFSTDGDVSPTLEGFTVGFAGTFNNGIQWDYDETLTLTITPLPDSGFDVTTRYALANAPAVGLSDTTDRDGDVDLTLDGFTPAFAGTVVNVAIDGDLVAALGDFSTSFVGDFESGLYFDVEYSVAPVFAESALPGNFGDIDITPDEFTVGFTGSFTSVDGVVGLVSTTISGFTVGFAGAYTAPPTFSGAMSLDIESMNASLLGAFAPSGGNIGQFDLTLDGFTPDFTGSFEVWSTDGDFDFTLDDFGVSVRGQFIDAGARSGLLVSTLGELSFNLTGSYVLPEGIDTAIMRMDTPSTAKMILDTPDTAIMRTRPSG